MTESEILGILIESANTNFVCELYYRKSVARDPIMPRFIEPYHLSTGKQDTLLRSYQTDPEEGWRSFMLHKIDSVELTHIPYKPRRKQTITTAEIHLQYAPSPHWTDGRKAYRDLICDALADKAVDALEFASIKNLIRDKNLKLEDIRYVHASLYHRALGMILQDGFITKEERNEIKFLHKVFDALGWAMGQ